MARQAIEAPPATPPLYSLLVAAQVIDGGSDRWQQGVEWAPEQTASGAAIEVDCLGGSPDGKPPFATPIRNSADPFAVYAEDHCSTIGFEARDFEGRARRQLIAVQSAFIASELQFGTIAGGIGGGDNVALIDGIEVGPGGQSAVEGLGVLEGVLAERFGGSRCMIHVTPQTLTELRIGSALIQNGDRWITALGTVVVADAGYSAEHGEAPPDAGVFMYGTGMVQIRLSPIVIVPGSFEDALARAQMTNRQTNDIEIRAERLALVQFDHSDQSAADLVFKVEIELPPWHTGS